MSLTPQEERLIRLAVAVAQRDTELLRELRRAAPKGEPDRAWRETLLQTHLFAGFPSVVEALRVLDQAGGIGTPTDEEARLGADDLEAGEEFFGKIYGENAAAVRTRIASTHPLFERWVIGHAYGRVLTREGLSPRLRELLAVACLAAQGLERQLASHVRGALAVGAKTDDVDATLEVIADRLTPRERERAQEVVARFSR